MILSGDLLGKLIAFANMQDAVAEIDIEIDDGEEHHFDKILACRERLKDDQVRQDVLEEVGQTLYTTNLPLPEALMSFFVAIMMEGEGRTPKSESCEKLFKLFNANFEFFDLFASVLRSYHSARNGITV